MLVDGAEYREFNGRGITIMVCSQCNTQCNHCYIGYESNFDPKELDEFVKNMSKKYFIYLNGSEPLMCPEYLKTYKAIGQHNCLSNGLLLAGSERLFNDLLENDIRFIGISYHFQFHDLISHILRDMIISSIRKAIHFGMNVTINCTVSKVNYKYVLENCEETTKIGAQRIRFTNLIYTGKAKLDCEKYVLNDEERKEFFRLLHIAREKYDESYLQIQRCGTFDRDIYLKSDHFCCDSINDFVVIAPDYSVYPCIFQTEPEDKIGFVKDNKIYIRKNLEFDKSKCTTFHKKWKL